MKFKTLLFFLLSISGLKAQETVSNKNFLHPADSLHKGRFYTALIGSSTAYTALMIGLNEAWYKDYPRSGFQFFNDGKEWEYMDKVGHVMSTYTESHYAFTGARWTGIPRRKAMWLGAGVGMLLQSSIEVLDGFSEKWGFSGYDMLANAAGAGFFIGQEMLWQEQRIVLKFSSLPPSYEQITFTDDSGNPINLQERIDDLYGTTLPERILKDYNGQTIWASFNINSFHNNSSTKIPDWLNIAVGYGAQNMYGGFRNEWEINEQGDIFEIPNGFLPRYNQFYLSPDIDLSRIKTKSPLLKTLLFLANALKVPAPAMEVNTNGKVRFWWLR
ncbi:MAG: DUF2279 domain-containing protein [Saprospiraceae bacterium]